MALGRQLFFWLYSAAVGNSPPVQPVQGIGKRLAIGGMVSTAARLAGSLISFALVAILTRLMRPEEVGTYFVALGLVNFTSLIADLGMRIVLVRSASEAIVKGNFNWLRAVIAKGLLISLLGTLVTTAVFDFFIEPWLTLGVFGGESFAAISGSLGIWTIAVTVQLVIADVFRGLQRYGASSIFSQVSANAILILMAFYAMESGVSITLAKLTNASIIAAFAVAAVSGSVLLKNLLSFPSHGNTEKSWPSVGMGMSIAGSSIINFALLNGDIWLVGIYGNPSDAAYYGAAAKMTALILIPISIANFIVPPVIAALYSSGQKAQLEKVLQATASLCGLPALLVLILIMVWSGLILGTAFSADYAAGGDILRVLSVASIVNVATGPCGQVMLMTGNHSQLLKIALFAIGIGVAAALGLGPEFGAIGVAVAACSANVVSNLTVWFWVRTRLGISTHMRLPGAADYRYVVDAIRARN